MSNLPSDPDHDNPPPWMDEAPLDYELGDDGHLTTTWAPPTTAGPATIEVEDLVAPHEEAVTRLRASLPPVLQRAVDRLMVGSYDPAAAAELHELASRYPGLEDVVARGMAAWEARHPKKGRNGNHRDAKPENVEQPVDILAGSLWSERVEEVLAWGRLPSVPFFVPTSDRGGQEVFRLKPGGIILLVGGTGAGKTSLALEAARCHALWNGPSAFFGLELSVPESGARLVGQHQGVTWLTAAELPAPVVKSALDVPRAHLFGRMGVAEIEKRIEALLKLYPDQPLLCVFDYAQILQDDMVERLQFAAILERLRLMIQRTQIIAILTSQGSRASSDGLRSGEKVGADTTASGAESAQLERLAYVTLAIGGDGEPDADGWRARDLNVGKSRMGEGDVVVPMRYHGASGRFAYAGEPQRAADVRARRVAEKKETDQRANDDRDENRVIDALKDRTEPCSRRTIEDKAGGKAANIRRAIQRLVDKKVLIEVGAPPRAGWLPPVMLASQCVPNASPMRPLDGTHPPAQCVPGPYVVGPGHVEDAGEMPHREQSCGRDRWDALTFAGMTKDPDEDSFGS